MDTKRMLGLDVNIPQITLRPIASMVAYHNNSRTHSEPQLAEIRASLLEFGWTNPILADALGTVAGHGRTMAAAELYRQGQQILFPNGEPIPIGLVPVIDCTGWSDAQRRAYIIADNKLSLNAGWDFDLLSLELGELDAIGFDLSLTGFDEDELADLLGVDASAMLGEMPELPTEDKDAFEKMSFTLHDEQAIMVRDALARAKALGAFDTTLNENSNGNALARICELFLMQNAE